MDIKLVPGQQLTKLQRDEVSKCYIFAANTYHGVTNPRDKKMRQLPRSEIPRLLRALGRPLTEQDVQSLLRGVPDQVDFTQFCNLLRKTEDKASMAEGELAAVLEALDLTGQGSLDP